MHRQRDSEGYSLSDLTRLTDVTPRTVRYYVSEGLLPPPVAAGRRSYYSESHLHRLRLIGIMKDAFLPLKEIRRRLQEMDDAEVLAAIDDLRDEDPHGRPAMQEELAPRLDETLSRFANEAPLEPQTWPFVANSPGEYNEPVPQEPAWRLPRPIKPARHEPHPSTTWRKLEIGDSAEFLIEERLYQRRREQIDALIVWAQRILDAG